jgi:hypothetical protein
MDMHTLDLFRQRTLGESSQTLVSPASRCSPPYTQLPRYPLPITDEVDQSPHFTRTTSGLDLRNSSKEHTHTRHGQGYLPLRTITL